MMRLSMDEIVNAVCLHTAERQQVNPTDVEVELSWEEQDGFGAEVWVRGSSQILNEANLLEAIERYMFTRYDKRVFRSQIELDVEDEIWADIKE